MDDWINRLPLPDVLRIMDLAQRFSAKRRQPVDAEMILFEKITKYGMTDEEADNYINLLTGKQEQCMLQSQM